MFHGFISDNVAGAHPKILEALSTALTGFEPSYGDDSYTAKAHSLFKNLFGEDTETFLVLTGTAANVLSLRAMLKPGQSVMCADVAHLNTEESGAPEWNIGCKIQPLPSERGKITPRDMEFYLGDKYSLHRPSPGAISITQTTEKGAVYTPNEIQAITSYAHKNGILVHMDGSRIANAVAALDIDINAITKDVGIDVLSFGGTKNGLVCAEAVVFFNTKLAEDFVTLRKQSLQMASKLRFVAAQFIASFEDDLWLQNARHANAMATYLAEELAKVPGVKVQSADANAVFACMHPEALAKLAQSYTFYEVDPRLHEIRLMCSFATQKEHIDAFVQSAKAYVFL